MSHDSDIRNLCIVTQYASTEPRQTLSGNPKFPTISQIMTAISRTVSALVSSRRVRIASTNPLQPTQPRSTLSYDDRSQRVSVLSRVPQIACLPRAVGPVRDSWWRGLSGRLAAISALRVETLRSVPPVRSSRPRCTSELRP